MLVEFQGRSAFDDARAHVLKHRGDEAAVMYMGREFQRYTFKGVLLSLGFDNAKAAGLLPEYKKHILGVE